MTHPESNGHVTDYVTWPWKAKGRDLISFVPIISSISVRWRASVACCGAVVLKTRLRLSDSCWSSQATHGQASVCAERCCTVDF